LSPPTSTPASSHLRMDAPLRPYIAQTNPPTTFSTSPHSCTATPCTLFLTRASSPPREPPPAPCHRRQAASVHPSPPKASNRCGLFPSCLSHLHPSPPATLFVRIWPTVAVPLCEGPICFDFNLSKKISVKSQGLICKHETRTLKTNLLTLKTQNNSQKNPKNTN
jgi:hypothetical protein